MPDKEVPEGPVDGLGQRERTLVLGQGPSEEGPAFGTGTNPDDSRDGRRGRCREWCHHRLGRAQLRQRSNLAREVEDDHPLGLIAGQHVIDREDAGGHEETRRRDQRIAVLFGKNRGTTAVDGFDVRAGVAHQSHGPKVEEGGAAMVPDPGCCPRRDRENIREVAAVRLEVLQPSSVREVVRDPPWRGPDADADPAVLATNSRGIGRF